MYALADAGQRCGMTTLAIGDMKSPDVAWPAGIEFIPVSEQANMRFALEPLLRFNHYSRKNLGYLRAISEGAEAVFDTDDDNAPLSHWGPPAVECDARAVRTSGWVNV